MDVNDPKDCRERAAAWVRVTAESSFSLIQGNNGTIRKKEALPFFRKLSSVSLFLELNSGNVLHAAWQVGSPVR